jgi:cytochrome c-type biogenesis protein
VTSGIGAGGLAFLSGSLSILSPCVLPLLPIILGASRAQHKFGAAALTAGVATSFVAIGLLPAAIGPRTGVDRETFRFVAAALSFLLGLVLIVPRLQRAAALAGGRVGNLLQGRFGNFSTAGASGQACLGLLLGAVWSPCAGPTLGAAALLAAQGNGLFEATLIMGAFGIGAAAPLAALGCLSRRTQARWRERLLIGAGAAKIGLGLALVALGALTLSGLDKELEAALVEASPDWLTALTTKY